MDLIIMLVALVLVAIVAIIVQRKWGSRRLLWVWIASVVITTSAILFWLSYNYGSPISGTRQQILSKVVLSIGVFIGVAIIFGVEVGLVSIFGPRPPQSASAEVNYFPFDMPLGRLENTDGLTGILRRYQELLSIFATALDTAFASTPLNPYQSIPRAVLTSFRIYSPNFLRQARASSSQIDRAPNALMRDLAGAESLLAELEKLTLAQLSAIEECHRVNVRRVRQRSVLRWDGWGRIAVLGAGLIATIKYGVVAVEQVVEKKPSDLWPFIRDINLPQAEVAIFILAIPLIFVTINVATFWPIFHRVRAFEDILTIAKAYRKGASEAPKPPADLGPTATG
jgi:hypothetical protein